MNIDINQLAGQLYTAYCAAVGGVAWNNDPLPSWDEFSKDPAKKKQADAWVEAALVSLRASSKIMRDCFKEWSANGGSYLEELERKFCAVVNADPGVTKYDMDLRTIIQESALKDMVADPATKPLFEFSAVPPMTSEELGRPPHWATPGDRIKLVNDFNELYDACRQSHRGGLSAGAACICGSSGTSAACRALNAIRDVLNSGDPKLCGELVEILGW